MATFPPAVIKAGRVVALQAGDSIDYEAPLTFTSPLSRSTNTISISTNGVGNTLLRQSAALSVVGRSANSIGDVADIAAASDGQALRRSGTSVGFGTLATAAYADNSVTLAKLATQSNNTVLGNVSGSTAVPTALTALQVQRLTIPIGLIVPYAIGTAPSGWSLCDGSAISRSTYADLFSLIGTTYGPGNGSTTFNVPDLRGRTVIGTGTGSGLTARSLAATGGAETVTLAIGEVPAHTHALMLNGGLTWHNGVGGSGANNLTAAGVAAGTQQWITDSKGGGGSHANMQPWLALGYIIFLGA